MRSPSTGEVEVPFSAYFHLARTGRHPGGKLVEGLRMSRVNGEDRHGGHGLPVGHPDREAGPSAGAAAEGGVEGRRPYAHVPVMVAEVVGLLEAVPAGPVLDATVGGGGHAAALLAAHPGLTIVGVDRDPAAVEAATAALAPFGPRAVVVRDRFDRLDRVLDGAGIGQLSGALFDLGVSSPQLDDPGRGFSYRADARLDMRMDPGQRLTAADVVNHADERDLARLLADSGERRFASRIVRAIVAARPLETTGQLAAVVRDAIPAAARRHGGHPARRVFQAIRIAVNDELAVLPAALDGALDRLVGGGRCVVLSYHSGEDRIVKDRFRRAATGGCVCPPGLPCVCGAVPTVRLLTRGARKPSPAEVAGNPRSESARLRAVERLPGAVAAGA
jgi:16S rRNA (cytosine1402-N4)-methyltransferase